MIGVFLIVRKRNYFFFFLAAFFLAGFLTAFLAFFLAAMVLSERSKLVTRDNNCRPFHKNIFNDDCEKILLLVVIR